VPEHGVCKLHVAAPSPNEPDSFKDFFFVILPVKAEGGDVVVDLRHPPTRARARERLRVLRRIGRKQRFLPGF
jgi:hypothetical protein